MSEYSPITAPPSTTAAILEVVAALVVVVGTGVVEPAPVLGLALELEVTVGQGEATVLVAVPATLNVLKVVKAPVLVLLSVSAGCPDPMG